MSIRVQCPGCGKNQKAPDHAVGRKGQCGRCGHLFRIELHDAVPADHSRVESSSSPSAAATANVASATVPPEPPEPPEPSAPPEPARASPPLSPAPPSAAAISGDLWRDAPLYMAAAILCFVWAGLMVLIAMIQVGLGAAGLALWNLLVSGAYVWIGIGLLQRRPRAVNFAIWSNVINLALGLIEILGGGSPVMVLLMVVEALILGFVIAHKDRVFPKQNKSGANHSRAATRLSGVFNSFRADMFADGTVRKNAYTQLTRGQKLARIGIVVAGPPILLVVLSLVISLGHALLGSMQHSAPSFSTGASSKPSVPSITVSGLSADYATFSNWYRDGSQIRGILDYEEDKPLGRMTYILRRNGVRIHDGRVNVPGRWTSPFAPAGLMMGPKEPVEIEVPLGQYADDDVSIELVVQ